jgi:hypothetical protein
MASALSLATSSPDQALHVPIAYDPVNEDHHISVNRTKTEPETTNDKPDGIDEVDFLKGLTENVRDQDDLERDIANQVRAIPRVHASPLIKLTDSVFLGRQVAARTGR